MAVLHETGHALYEQGLPKSQRGQPVGLALGMMIHESQSLFWEMQICRSREFFEFAGPIIRNVFSQKDQSGWSNEELYRQAIEVQPGYIRVDADEVSYPLHVILRFEIEQDLFADKMTIVDLPEVWDHKMKNYFGLSTKGNDQNGCMQDVHWPSGAFGYFPCYSLGAIVGAQWFSTMKKTIPDVRAKITRGDLSPILSWLRKNVHEQGRLISASELIEKITGSPIDAPNYIEHLQSRY